jgi:hypothetical protein
MALLVRSSPLILALIASPVAAQPIVPNFTQGVLSSHTETRSTVTEDIRSFDIKNGYTLTVGGTNVAPSGGRVSPSGFTRTSGSVDGVGTTYVSPNLSSKPQYSIVDSGAAFSYYETLDAPGISNYTHIIRTTEIEQITDSTSTFQ